MSGTLSAFRAIHNWTMSLIESQRLNRHVQILMASPVAGSPLCRLINWLAAHEILRDSVRRAYTVIGRAASLTLQSVQAVALKLLLQDLSCDAA